MLRTSLLVMLTAAGMSCGPRNQPSAISERSERKGQTIALSDRILAAGGSDTVRFGHLRSGEIAVRCFELENRTERSIAVTSYVRSCGCTTLQFDTQPIAPGQARRLTLVFDSRGEHGWQLKTLDITLAGAPGRLRLFVEADVE